MSYSYVKVTISFCIIHAFGEKIKLSYAASVVQNEERNLKLKKSKLEIILITMQ